MNDALRLESPQTLGAEECGNLGRIEHDFRRPRHLQHIAAMEVDEDQPGTRIDQEIAQGVEKQVAREIRDRQRAVFIDTHEARLAAAMGGIDLAHTIAHDIRRYVERI